ncbi:Hsp20/alpha crystallin family protein [Salegentibacter salegens]|uniref:Hsp20/alpha crystallin family protein n=1 Tax=Salegentibacter salegens TaxID=143223 RepID=UPI00389A7CA0
MDKTKEDFKIELNNDVLTITCEGKKENRTSEKNEVYQKRISYSTFKRAFSLNGKQL